MAPLDTGKYVITNSKHRNVAFLPDATESSDIVASDQKDDLGEMVRNILSIPNVSSSSPYTVKWDVDLLSNTNYRIQNYGYNSLTNSETHVKASLGDNVVGGNTRQQWKIIETKFPGHYWYAFSLCVSYFIFNIVLDEGFAPQPTPTFVRVLITTQIIVRYVMNRRFFVLHHRYSRYLCRSSSHPVIPRERTRGVSPKSLMEA
jgi:hypothetical protein